VKLALMLPAYQGAVLARMQQEQRKAEPETAGDGSYQPDEYQHETSHRIAQAQPVATAEQIAALTGKAPGVGMWGEVIRVKE